MRWCSDAPATVSSALRRLPSTGLIPLVWCLDRHGVEETFVAELGLACHLRWRFLSRSSSELRRAIARYRCARLAFLSSSGGSLRSVLSVPQSPRRRGHLLANEFELAHLPRLVRFLCLVGCRLRLLRLVHVIAAPRL